MGMLIVKAYLIIDNAGKGQLPLVLSRYASFEIYIIFKSGLYAPRLPFWQLLKLSDFRKHYALNQGECHQPLHEFIAHAFDLALWA